MGYIIFGKSNNIQPQDPRLMRIFIAWLVIFLILIMTKIEIFGIELSRIWGGLLLVAIGLFVLLTVAVIILHQTKLHFPDFFDKLPERIKKIAE